MKVFISSTYKDLIDYRAAAIRAVEGTNYQASKMEVFGARPDEPLDACLKEVEESELFIGIYALRYGFVPEGADISITEMEYVHAKKLGKEIYCFLLDEENQPWLKKWIEGESGKSKLEDFKKRIQKLHVCDYFTTPDDLRAKVSNALSLYVSTQKTISDSQSPTYQSPKPTGNTLPNQEFFVGRDKERDIILSALSPESRTWGALIDGPGGIGKSALAIHAAHKAEGFERKIFITAKVRELNADGEAKLTDFTRPTYLAMLDELGKELGADGLEKLAPDERPNELRLALAGKKALIIFDNLETLPEEERTRLFQFLSRLPEGNKAIVTSRRRTDVDARIVRLDRLARDEALQLIAELAAKYPRLSRTAQKEREDLYEITQGNPLFIRWIAGQLGREGSQCRTIAEACAFIDKAPKGNDPLEYIFGDLLKTATPDQTKVLAALTYFSLPAKLKWIADMTTLRERAAETALEDLTDRSILTSDLSAQTYFLPPLTAKFIRTRRPEAVTQTGDALGNKALALALQHGYRNYEDFKILEHEWHFIEASWSRLSLTKPHQLRLLRDLLHQFLNFSGRWDEEILLNQMVEQNAIKENDNHGAGLSAFYIGYIHFVRKQSDEVLSCALRAETYWKEARPREKATAMRLLGLGYQLKGEHSKSIELFKESLATYQSIDPEMQEVIVLLNDLAVIHREIGSHSLAEKYYQDALIIAKKNNDTEQIAGLTGNLAQLYIEDDRWEDSWELSLEALELDEKIGRSDFIGIESNRLAQILIHQNHLEEALPLARRAIEILTRLKLSEAQWAKATLMKIEKALSSNQ